MKSGLVSVSFRKLSPEQIVRMTAQAGLQGIEWGGDVHVPHGDLPAARRAASMTADSGLAVSAYGSYYRTGDSPELPFERVLESAAVLRAPTIRVWAGRTGSAAATPQQWRDVVADARRIADFSMGAGMTVSFEFHRNTLTDSGESTVRLLREIAHPNVRTYWQPPLGMAQADCLRELEALLPWLSNLHVFHWVGEPAERHFLDEGADVWERYLRLAARSLGEHYASLEFVKDDSPEVFQRDAATLISLSALAPRGRAQGATSE